MYLYVSVALLINKVPFQVTIVVDAKPFRHVTISRDFCQGGEGDVGPWR